MSSHKNKQKLLADSNNPEMNIKKSSITEEENIQEDLNKSGSDNEISTTTYPLKITIIGNSNVGKTSILKRFLNNKFDENSTSATIMATFQSKKLNVDAFSIAELQIWDTAGQEKYRSTTRNYFIDSKGILLVFDLTDIKSFNDLDSWMEEINDVVSDKVVKMLVGNKSDLTNKVIDYEKANKYAKDHNMQYLSVSAKEGLNIELLFEKLGSSCIKAIKEEQNQIEKEELNKNEKDARSSNLSGQFENDVHNENINISGNNKSDKKSTKCC